jgi:membrane-bound ClpP family serine protease
VSTATVLFLIIGGIGVLLLALSLFGVELLDLDGLVPMEVVAAMLGTFGFGAAIASSLWNGSPAVTFAGSAGVGVLASLPAGWLTVRLVRAAQQMRTDATPNRDDLLGSIGVVISPIPEQGYGEIRTSLGGQPVKLYATAQGSVPTGTEVFVITATSETSGVVEPVPNSS